MVAFVRQCQYNSDMAPDRIQLQKVCKKLPDCRHWHQAHDEKDECSHLVYSFGVGWVVADMVGLVKLALLLAAGGSKSVDISELLSQIRAR